MFDRDIEAHARQILARRKDLSIALLDDAALNVAKTRPVIVCKAVGNILHGIVDTLSGASASANQAGGYYQDAMGRLISATGSPAAQTFGREEAAALQPQFNQQDQGLAAKEAAMGITNSGAAKADFSNLKADQSATLAGSIAPLYQSAIGQYGNIDAAMPGAQQAAYQDAVNNFYNSVQMAATGVPGGRQTSAVGQSPYGTTPPYSSLPGGAATPGAIDVSGMPTNPYAPDYNPYSATG